MYLHQRGNIIENGNGISHFIHHRVKVHQNNCSTGYTTINMPHGPEVDGRVYQEYPIYALQITMLVILTLSNTANYNTLWREEILDIQENSQGYFILVIYICIYVVTTNIYFTENVTGHHQPRITKHLRDRNMWSAYTPCRKGHNYFAKKELESGHWY